jgi:hypothetical protein
LTGDADMTEGATTGAVPRRRSSLAPIPGEETGAPPPDAVPRAQGPTADGDGPWLLAGTAETVPAWEHGSDEPDRGPKPVAQKVVAIAFVRARRTGAGKDERLEVVECRAGGNSGANEKTLVTGFVAAFDAWKPKPLVTFNGRGFLVPVLRYACMRHSIAARWLNEAGDGKWEGYMARNSQAWHCDVMDLLCDQRASAYPSLADAARAVGVPHAGDAALDPRSRAASNAATAFLLNARLRLFTGKMSREAHDLSVASLRTVLENGPDEGGARSLLETWTA